MNRPRFSTTLLLYTHDSSCLSAKWWTGGTGFIAAHILDLLLENGHSVVTTVRSDAKAQTIKDAHPNVAKDMLDFAIVEDIAQEEAFAEAVTSTPPFEIVIHTSSPFHFNVTDVKKDLLDPAVIGTTGLLKAIKQSAPTVKRVVCSLLENTFLICTAPTLNSASWCVRETWLTDVGHHKFLRRYHQSWKGHEARLHLLRERLGSHHRRRGHPESFEWVSCQQDIRGESCLGFCRKREAKLYCCKCKSIDMRYIL